jgi:FdhE protein
MMDHEIQARKETGKIEKAVHKIEKEIPSLKSVLDAFKEIFIGRTLFKATFSDLPNIPISPPDSFQFSQGVPLLSGEMLSRFVDSWEGSVDFMIPYIKKGFPKIKPELARLKAAMEKGHLNLIDCMKALLKGKEKKIDEIALNLETQPLILKFILDQLMKPFLEKRIEATQPLIQGLPWHKGYCPLCGSFPELSFLQGDEGQRWLRCALCGHEWRFVRTICPFCENDDHERMEFYFVEGREHERAELCYKCKRYIVNIDLRKCAEEVVREVAAIGMLYLDILAQGKGFLPVAVCAWNVLARGDIATWTGPFRKQHGEIS